MMVKRGRPGIKPHIERLIVLRVSKDREKPRDEWTPRKALAFELQREIEGMDEPAPELSTLEKRISDYSNKIESPDDKESPWSIFDIANPKYTIPSEALPTVLRMLVYERVTYRHQLTIRQALWVARLYSVFREAGLDEKPLLISTLCIITRSLAHGEKFIEQTRKRRVKPEDIYPNIETELFELMAEKSDPLREELESLSETTKEAHHERPHSQQRKP